MKDSNFWKSKQGAWKSPHHIIAFLFFSLHAVSRQHRHTGQSDQLFRPLMFFLSLGTHCLCPLSHPFMSFLKWLLTESVPNCSSLKKKKKKLKWKICISFYAFLDFFVPQYFLYLPYKLILSNLLESKIDREVIENKRKS